MNTEHIIKALQKGKNIYFGSCLNADVDGIPMEFKNDKEAIQILSDYEAKVHKFYLDEDNDLRYKCIYDPWDCFG